MSDLGHMHDDPPAGLSRELRALYRAPIPVEPRVSEAVAALARERAALGLRRRSVSRLARWGLVAAAGLALGISLTVYLTRPPSVTRVARAEDVNRDGVVDILDALALERAIEGGTGPARSRSGFVDVNGDGTVDKRDVDRIAMAAVALKGG